MTPNTIHSGNEQNSTAGRYRLPGIERAGIAQLSILETALWPVQGGVRDTLTFDTQYKHKIDGEQRDAQVSVYAPRGLESIDEYILWGLLGLSLNHKNSNPTLLATPYWIIKKLGMSMGGSQYVQLRESIERLALVAYQNTAFYNPLSQEHERVTFHFFSSFFRHAIGERPLITNELGGSNGRRHFSKCVRQREARCCSTSISIATCHRQPEDCSSN